MVLETSQACLKSQVSLIFTEVKEGGKQGMFTYRCESRGNSFINMILL